MVHAPTGGTPTAADVELVRSAQSGEVGGLGLLLARHRGPMYAVALSILGPGSDAEDVVQDACLTALRRIGDVRNPEAVGSWLQTLVRNGCRMRLRARTAVPVADVQGLARLPAEPDPAELLERSASRDWIWAALEELSPTLRLPAMLRYFTDVTAYEQIAALCEVPIGTVRSRLSQARRKLAEALLATADAPYDDAAALTEAQRIQGEEVLRSARRGAFAEALAELWSPTVELTWPSGRRTQGFAYLVGAMERDLSDGVRQTLVNVVASREVVIWESDLVSPPEDPFHCPPSVVWVQLLEAGRVQRVRFFHPRRDAGVMTAVAS